MHEAILKFRSNYQLCPKESSYWMFFFPSLLSNRIIKKLLTISELIYIEFPSFLNQSLSKAEVDINWDHFIKKNKIIWNHL